MSDICTPVDIENKFVDMVQGSIIQGINLSLRTGFLGPKEQCFPNQMLFNNLHLAAPSEPHGYVLTFGSGYVAANTVPEESSGKKWSSASEILTKARKEGVI